MTDNVMVENRTTSGHTVLFYADALCTMFGAHGVRISPTGEVDVLILGPEENGWVAIDEATLVQAGSARTKAKKN